MAVVAHIGDRHMTAVTIALVATTLFSAPTEQPVELAKGDGYVVHAFGGTSGGWAVFGPQPVTALHLLHTALPSGRLTALFRSGTTVGIPVPMGLNRTPYSQTQVVGVATDAERLYVLVWSAKWVVLGDARGEVKPPESDDYALRVYWLADGSEVGTFAVGGAMRPKVLPRESVEAGTLELGKGGGVSVYGETFRFKGKQRAK